MKGMDSSASIFVYEPLRGDEIRLVRIHWDEQRNAPIACTLEHVSLSTKPTFAALSYVWGDASITRPIQLNGCAFHITTNLYDGLVEIRGKYAQNEDFWIWIDALCINQSDMDERSEQVPRMTQIYSSAYSVIAWLGPLDPSERDCTLLLFQLCEGACMRLAEGQISLEPNLLDPPSMAKAFYDVLEERNISMTQFQFAALEFAARKWFRRIWVVQEVVLARTSPEVIIGDLTIELERLLPSVVFLLESHRDVALYYILEAPRSLILYRSSSSMRIRRKPTQMSSTPKEIAKRLLEALQQTRNCGSIDARDRIYGVLGLVGCEGMPKNLKPNYKTRYEDVFHAYAAFIFQYTGDPSLIGGWGHKLEGVPTWVPDFERLVKYENWPCTPSSTQFDFSADRKNMSVEGIVTDRIMEVFPRRIAATLDDLGRALLGLKLPILAEGALRRVSGDDMISEWLALDLHDMQDIGLRRIYYQLCVDTFLKRCLPGQDSAFTDIEKADLKFWFTLRVSSCSFITRRGYLGMAWNAKKGDVISALKGAENFVVLRASGPNFKVVGATKMSGKFWKEHYKPLFSTTPYGTLTLV